MRILIAAVLAVAALSAEARALDEPALLADINQEVTGLPIQRLAAAGTRLFFTAGTSLGNELWSSDGTPGGTVLARDINPFGNGDPDWLRDVGATLFFSADDGVNGRELWRSDGTLAGTVMVKDIRPGPGSSDPTWLVAFGGALYF